MKNRILIISFCLISSLISSCSPYADFNCKTDFKNSRKAWLNFKESTNNSYQYTVRSATWTGTKETTISVSNGVITKRHYEYTATGSPSKGLSKDKVEWTENENEIGTHQNGAEGLTLDAVYDKAQQNWLIKRENSQTYFETQNNGMISTCGYRHKNCADDCFNGIHIKNIEAL